MNKFWNALLVLAVIGLICVPLALHEKGDETQTFTGTDDQAQQAIKDVNPDYSRWAEPLWTPPSSEVASLLFAVQASLGTLVLGYVLGFYRGRATRDGRANERA
ncbi:energy-coupling factor ABC transporter substrate-binding protein [Limnoglobus roseus]|uniref:Cobalt transport protein CbiN n=1 Tax=Limnoglobus roseus TaxID=2598579 RepID=A0A5C1AFN9_9BACT|nr:energy-coupling factor ABC transporter substrate-binding protein [Limnoglobus roseus]QEL18239.1 Cobalt transport protein CbiN [Limnoglobus roseus]